MSTGLVWDLLLWGQYLQMCLCLKTKNKEWKNTDQMLIDPNRVFNQDHDRDQFFSIKV
jgi:hypothetical protein